ncbi:MAG TPA: hypothetical protein VFT89_07230 [Rhizobiaceae bacterium]|nr:hypothetical protein [Rhizobiaceae bacterium]
MADRAKIEALVERLKHAASTEPEPTRAAVSANAADALTALLAEMDQAQGENAWLRDMFFRTDADRRQWYLSDLIARLGHFNRGDLCEAFGISVPQASADIRRFLASFPYVAVYNKSAKRYERAALKQEGE